MSDAVNLTKRAIEALPIPAEGRVEYRDTVNRYLRLIVTAGGRQTWRYVRKVAGRTRFYTCGTYPEMTPDMARRECLRLSAEYDAGKDPAQAKKQLRSLLTWSDLFGWYMDTHAKPHKRSWRGDENQERLYCATWRKRPYTAIDADLVTHWHKGIGKDHGKFAADRTLAMVKTVFAKAIETGVIQGQNPAAHVHKFYATAKEYGRVRFLSTDELGRLLRALNDYHDPNMADFFTVALFTGARRGNIMSMKWGDMDRTDPNNPRWVIPAPQSKNKSSMAVPLLPPVLVVLNRRFEDRKSDEYVFPSRRSDAKTPHLCSPKKAWATIRETAGLKDVRIHDLRRTMGSWQSLLGASMQVIGRSLGHKSIQSTEIYARLNDDPVRASMGQAITAMLKAGEGGAK